MMQTPAARRDAIGAGMGVQFTAATLVMRVLVCTLPEFDIACDISIAPTAMVRSRDRRRELDASLRCPGTTARNVVVGILSAQSSANSRSFDTSTDSAV
jgi:hypothetical protein